MNTPSPTSPVAIITIENAELLALQNRAAGEHLCNELLRLAADDSVKVIVLQVLPSATSAQPVPPSSPLGTYLGPAGLYQTMVFCRKPVIAQLHGPIGPMGALIGLYADITVADIASNMPSPFDVVPSANFMMAALTMRLDRAKAWLLSAEPLTVREAEEMGLVNLAVPNDQVHARAMELAERAAQMPLDAITVSKMNVNANLDAMGVGQDFDLAGFFGAGMQVPTQLGMK